ncbi:ABC transporter ATP-binding protein [Marivirga sp.]|uniref:ABC transporter ATP-binding protein n=1 Tax=Marivirga sp. TaxID=2018662 RepID=UPI003DA7826B
MTRIIEIKNLTKKFRTEEIETTALNNVNITIQRGEFVAIMGPSGCGKSTLLNILGMLDCPNSGEYFFLDSEVSNYNERKLSKIRKGEIGFVFQSFNLIEELTVFENVELPLQYLMIPSTERRDRVEQVLKKMDILHRKKHFPQQLSGGQQQRVAISRALVTSPAIILADEPTGNLDSSNGEEVMKLLKSLNEEGTTIIMVTHSSNDSKYARRIIKLLDGKVVNQDEVKSFQV